MTDAAIEASGETIEEAFENAALAVVDTMVVLQNIEPTSEVVITASGQEKETLLFDWLDKVLLTMLVDRFVMRHFQLRIRSQPDGFHLEATASGEKLDVKKHGYRVEIKGVTFHEMEIAKTGDRYVLKFLLDL